MLLYAECGLNADGPRNIAIELNIFFELTKLKIPCTVELSTSFQVCSFN